MVDSLESLERHEVPRVPCNSSVTFAVGPGDVVIGRIRELSISGLGNLTSRQFSVGATVRIHVPPVGSMHLTF